MCLGIPGRITAITDEGRLMAMAEVSGVRREVSVACVAGNDLAALVGQWALIHVGFAMALIDEDEAADDEAGLCAYVGEDGVRCRNHARPGSRYCGVHADLDEA